MSATTQARRATPKPFAIVLKPISTVLRHFYRGTDVMQGLRVFVGLAVPGIALLIMNRPELMVYAVFGSVTGMYGRSTHRLDRLQDQVVAAAMIVGAGLTGILVAPLQLDSWILLCLGIICASAASAMADWFQLSPGGAFFPLFAFGALATLPVGAVPKLDGLATFLVAVMISILVGQLAGSDVQRRIRSDRFSSKQLLNRAASYAAVLWFAGTIAIALDFEYLHWVMAGAVVPLAAGNARGRLKRAIHRVVGTVCGLVVLIFILNLDLSPWFLGLAVILLMFPTEAYMVRNYGLALSFFTPLIMMMLELAAPDTGEALWERAAANMLGVAAGLVASLPFDQRIQNP